MADTSIIRNGLVINHKNNLFKIIEFQHVKPGKGGAFVRTKLKNVKTGQVIDETFRSGEKIEEIRLDAQNFNFLWAFPFNFVLIFAICKNKIPIWFIGYIKLLIILIVLLFLHWLTGVQKYNITLLSIFIALLIRYSFLVYYIKKNKK